MDENKVNKLAGFKVGDTVIVKRGVSSQSESMHGQTGKIVEIYKEPHAGHVGWVYINDTEGGGIWIDELTHVNKVDDDPNAVVKRTNILITKEQLSVQHTTNSKKGRVGLLKQGRVMGHIRFEEIDTYINLLEQLKSEV